MPNYPVKKKYFIETKRGRWGERERERERDFFREQISTAIFKVWLVTSGGV